MQDLDLVPTDEVELRGRGPIGQDDRDGARAAIADVLARHGCAGGARVRLTGGHHPGGPLVVQVNLRVAGAPARVQVDGPTPAAAIAAAAVRLDHQVQRLRTVWEPWPWPD